MKPKETKRCRICDAVFKPFKTTDRCCSYTCMTLLLKQKDTPKKSPRKPIPKLSPKRKKENAQYLKSRIDFLNKPENKICFIDECNESATTIEHTAGRIGTKYLDQKFWKPCCYTHNSELENNTALSEKYQFSKFHDGKKIKK